MRLGAKGMDEVPVRLAPGPPVQKETTYARMLRLLREMSDRVVIDRNNVDTELMQQAERFRAAGDEAAFATSYRDAAASHLAEVTATVEIELRDEAVPAGAKARTDAHVKALVSADKRVTLAKSNLSQWKLLADRFGNLERSLDMRGKMLRAMVQREVTGFYSDGAVRGAQHQSRDAIAEQARRDIEEDIREEARTASQPIG